MTYTVLTYTMEWSIINTLNGEFPIGRADSLLLPYNDCLVLYGGTTMQGPVSELRFFVPESHSWTPGGNTWRHINNDILTTTVGFIRNDKLHVMGGSDNNTSNLLTSILVIDLETAHSFSMWPICAAPSRSETLHFAFLNDTIHMANHSRAFSIKLDRSLLDMCIDVIALYNLNTDLLPKVFKNHIDQLRNTRRARMAYAEHRQIVWTRDEIRDSVLHPNALPRWELLADREYEQQIRRGRSRSTRPCDCNLY